MVKNHAHTTSCSICGEIKMTIRSGDALGQFLKKKKKKKKKKKNMENSTILGQDVYGTFTVL